MFFSSKKSNNISRNPTFNGTIDDFNVFMSGYCRNSVQKITRKYKSEVGKCEHCGVTGVQLDAAHIHGKERKSIIEKILKKYVEFDDIIKVDLNSFQTEFIDAHMPINETIKILCKTCHVSYDSKFNMDKTPSRKKYLKPAKHYFEYSRLTFVKQEIDKLNMEDVFTIYVSNSNETFSMSKNDFYKTFDNVVNSKSYKRGNYNYYKIPSKAYEFLVKS